MPLESRVRASEEEEEEEMVRIVLEDRAFQVSKRKLMEKSDYFRALYRSGMKECGEDSQQLHGLSPQGLELVIGFIDSSQLSFPDESLQELIEAASFLQVTRLLELLRAQVRLENCVRLHQLAQTYGVGELQATAAGFMADHYHQMLRRADFQLFPAAFRAHIREKRMRGTATLLAVGNFLDSAVNLAHEDKPWAMLKYDEASQRWQALTNNLPPAMVNVRGYGSVVLDNYLFIVGGYRVTIQEISAAHCYNPCRNEWSQIVPMNQKRSNFKLLAVNGNLYAIGGQSLSNVECYSPEHDTWTLVAPLPGPLAEFSACECQGKIYVVGGYTTRGRNLSILQYCPTANAWTVLGLCGFHIRKQQMLSLEDTIFLVGGCIHYLEPNQEPTQRENILTLQSYNTATQEWVCLKENTSKSGLNLTCTLHNDGIYIMSRDVTTSTSLEHRVYLKYNIFTNAWESFRRIKFIGQNMAVCSLYLPNDLEM
ncbi:kelch-like protein 42 [Rhinatrema bivittatum]|uniref:kelch-like protein 42 n=1 Tax=Rhinatrema bivittatum TaxID=194408 RepID=UPI00112C42E9|nr:kelch-like protein 42 [Rhinatrema bivittatum]